MYHPLTLTNKCKTAMSTILIFKKFFYVSNWKTSTHFSKCPYLEVKTKLVFDFVSMEYSNIIKPSESHIQRRSDK